MPLLAPLRWRLAATLVLLGTALLGCNVYDDVGPPATDPGALLADAQIALANGRPQKAVRLLNTAYEADSASVGVRVELSNALYAVHGIDAFLLRSVLERMTGRKEVETADTASGAVCTGGAMPGRVSGRYAALLIGTSEGLDRLANQRDELRRVSRLLVDGVLGRRADALAEQSPEMQAKAELLAALTRMGQRLVRVRRTVRETNSALYLDAEAAPPALVACSPTELARARTEQSMCELRKGTEHALAWLRTRNDRLRSDQTGILIDALARLGESLRGRLTCGQASRLPLDSPRPQRPRSG